MSDEESDDEHDENEKNEFVDVEKAAYFLNPFGTLRIECIYSFALTMKICNSRNCGRSEFGDFGQR